MIRHFLYLAIFVFHIGFVENVVAEDHVRVLLDTSISMRKTVGGYPPQDPSKLSVLSVKLLTDLLYPIYTSVDNNNANSSYKIFTFNKDYGNLPTSGFPIHRKNNGTNYFVLGRQSSAWRVLQSQLDTITRKSFVTYFYPGLKSIISSFNASREYDTRIIILITDGRSDSGDPKYNGSLQRYAEEKKRLELLANTMDAKNIKLYILAFGPTIDLDFLRTMITPTTGGSNSVGEIVPITSVDQLMAGMSKIFSDNFGYQIEPVSGSYLSVNSSKNFDLNAGTNSKFVGVLSLAEGAIIPQFSLSPSTGTSKNIDIYNKDHKGEKISPPNSTSLGGGYYLKWLSSPSGEYTYTPDSPSTQKVIILRPLDIDVAVAGVGQPSLDILNDPAGVINIMADTPVEIYYHAKTSGSQGGVPPVNLTVQYTKRKGGWNITSNQYDGWNIKEFFPADRCSLPASCAIPPNAPTGTWFHKTIKFDVNDNDSTALYEASLPVIALFKKRPVGSTEKSNAKKVRVYPKISFIPIPQAVNLVKAGTTSLKNGDQGCATFRFKEYGQYYNAFNKKIHVMANITVDSSSSNAIDILNKATFTLDGKVLDNPSYLKGIIWDKTYQESTRTTLEQLTLGAILINSEYQHQICMKVGFPLDGGSIKLNLNLVIQQPPYDRISNLIQPLKVRLNVKSPDWIPPYLLFLLPFLLLLWLLKFIPEIEDDLRYTYYKKGDEASITLQKLTTNPLISFYKRLFNLVNIYEIKNIQNKTLIAFVRPIANKDKVDDLYAIKIVGSNIQIETLNRLSDEVEPDIIQDGSWNFIHINQPYRLSLNNEEYIFRLEYESAIT